MEAACEQIIKSLLPSLWRYYGAPSTIVPMDMAQPGAGIEWTVYPSGTIHFFSLNGKLAPSSTRQIISGVGSIAMTISTGLSVSGRLPEIMWSKTMGFEERAAIIEDTALPLLNKLNNASNNRNFDTYSKFKYANRIGLKTHITWSIEFLYENAYMMVVATTFDREFLEIVFSQTVGQTQTEMDDIENFFTHLATTV